MNPITCLFAYRQSPETVMEEDKELIAIFSNGFQLNSSNNPIERTERTSTIFRERVSSNLDSPDSGYFELRTLSEPNFYSRRNTLSPINGWSISQSSKPITPFFQNKVPSPKNYTPPLTPIVEGCSEKAPLEKRVHVLIKEEHLSNLSIRINDYKKHTKKEKLSPNQIRSLKRQALFTKNREKFALSILNQKITTVNTKEIQKARSCKNKNHHTQDFKNRFSNYLLKIKEKRAYLIALRRNLA